MTALRLVPDAPRRFAVAVRVSQVRGRSGDSFHSPEVQEAAARRAVEAVGGVVDETVGVNGIFYDLDVSGAVAPSSRPGLGVALQHVRDGRLEGVAVYDVSRFSRDTVGGLRELEEIAALGGQVVSAAETIDLGTPSGLFTTTVMLAAARMKRDETAKKWREVHERRHAQGQFHARVPLGYLIEDGQAVVDPVLGPLVTWAFEAYLAGRVTQTGIAERLTQARGMRVRQGTVSNLLRNPFHAGQVMYRRERRPGAHVPLVDEWTFEAVQRKLARDMAERPKQRAPMSAVSGLVYCTTCQKPLHRQSTDRKADGRVRVRMRCPTDGCVGVGAPYVDELEAAVLEHVLADAEGSRDRVPAAVARRAKAQQAERDRAGLAQQRDTILRQMATAEDKLAAEVLADDAYQRLAVRLQDRLADVERRLAAALDVPAARSPQELASMAERIRRLWGRMTPIEQRAALSEFVPRAWLRRAAYRGEPMADRLRYPE
jgi:DNA invertase Pin-like site-specific DNA recombinase